MVLTLSQLLTAQTMDITLLQTEVLFKWQKVAVQLTIPVVVDATKSFVNHQHHSTVQNGPLTNTWKIHHVAIIIFAYVKKLNVLRFLLHAHVVKGLFLTMKEQLVSAVHHIRNVSVTTLTQL